MPTGFEKYPHLYGTTKWRKLRLMAADRDEYTCRMCKRIIGFKFHSDHIKPHNGDEELFYDLDNIQTLCKHCHNSHKQMEEIHGYTQACDENGMPTNPNHPWNKGRQ